jgi:hypothetical protein
MNTPLSISTLEKASEELLQLNPLAARKMEVFGEASYPYAPRDRGGWCFWGVRRNCSYTVTSGMLPGTESPWVSDVDEDDLARFGWELRTTAKQAVAEVLRIDLDDLDAEQISLDNSHTGNVDMVISPLWSVTIQNSWRSSKYAEASQILISYFVQYRGGLPSAKI